MNIENMKALKAQLEEIEDAQFYMGTFFDTRSCGTVACLGGWAVILAGVEFNLIDNEFYRDDQMVDVEDEAAAFLGLTKDESMGMFFPYLRDVTLPHGMCSTRAQAIEYLDNVIRTGSVWARDHQ